MDISELIGKQTIIFDYSIQSKDVLFEVLSDSLKKNGSITKKKGFMKDLYKREQVVSTGIEEGFGIPHAKSKYVVKPTVCFAHTSSIRDYVGFDDEPIECVFMIAVPKKSNSLHLDVLSSLSRRLLDDEFRKKVKNAKNSEEILAIINE